MGFWTRYVNGIFPLRDNFPIKWSGTIVCGWHLNLENQSRELYYMPEVNEAETLTERSKGCVYDEL